MIANRLRWIAPALLALLAVACDSNNVAVVDEQGEQSDKLKAFLDSPAPGVGAHKQNDPHARLDAGQMAQVALQHLDEGRMEPAMATLNEALAKFPDDVFLLNVRSSLNLQHGETSLALADLNHAIELNPHDPVLLNNRAQAYRQFGRHDNAREDLDSAIGLDPAFIAAHFNRGSLHFEAERYDLALLDFDRCIELQPEVPAAYFNRASTHEVLGDREAAIEDLEQFLTLSPDPAWVQVAEDMLQQWRTETS